MSYHSRLSETLQDLFAQAADVAVVAAPFIKLSALSKATEQLDPSVQLLVFTRWRVDEIVSGVSDLSIWRLISERPKSAGFLVDELHAKFFRSDSNCLVGSANVTATALGFAKRPNLELLVPMPFNNKLQDFESALRDSSFEITQAIYDEISTVVNDMPMRHLVEYSAIPEREIRCWIPGIRNPQDLWRTYIDDVSLIPQTIQTYADFELSQLGIPMGIDNEALFDRAIALTLSQKPVIREIDFLLDQPRRFGEVKNRVKELTGLENDDANRAWQTLMRWMLYFFPDRYEKIQPRYSEIFQKRP